MHVNTPNHKSNATIQADEDTLHKHANQVIDAIQQRLASLGRPIVVAIDGGSGAGKSSLAAMIQNQLDAALISLDNFFSAYIPDQQWEDFSPEERLEHVFDWQRLRCQVIKPLLRGETARWQAFDFLAGPRPDGTYPLQDEFKQKEPAAVILIEGAYSASPPLADMVDLTLLIDIPLEVRHARLAAREEHNFLTRWHTLWDPVEALYFNQVRPKESFDIVLSPD
jgi:uridine kinase